jgi:diaminopimelate decarboxylase
LLAIDLDVVDAAIATWHAACDPLGMDISYAAKAFTCVAFLRYVKQLGIGVDVCSLGELVTAERAGCAPSAITFHGAGKTGDELQAIAGGRAGCVAVDGLEELTHLASLTFHNEAPVDVLIRSNTGIEAHTHAFVRTGGDDTKFGLHRRDEPAAANILRAAPGLRFVGVHSHVGSQIYEAEAFAANAEALVETLARFRPLGLAGHRIVIGGGYGVPMLPGEPGEDLDPRSTIAAAAQRAAVRAVGLGIEVPAIGVEPGRSIVAAAGTTFYRVMAIKQQSNRTFVVVDGGLFENPRPGLYSAYHHVVVADGRRRWGQDREVTLCGRSCENDELGIARLPADLTVGELLASCATGAYTFSMAGNYNRFVRPAVVAVRGREHGIMIRRETIDDVLARDADA